MPGGENINEQMSRKNIYFCKNFYFTARENRSKHIPENNTGQYPEKYGSFYRNFEP